MAVACLGLVALWCNHDLLRGMLESKPAMGLARFSFFVFAAHGPLLVVPAGLWYRLAGSRAWAFPAAFVLVPASAMTACVLGAVLLRRFARPFYRLLGGGRG